MTQLIGINEAMHVPQHPEVRLANLALRGRQWNGGRMNLFAGAGEVYPLGEYMLRWKGDGLVTLNASLPGGHTGGNEDVYTVSGYSSAGLFLGRSGDVHDIELYHLGTPYVFQFTKSFIDQLSQFSIWRPMDLTKTNGSKQVEWADRPLPTDEAPVWFEKGWPWETIIDAANVAGVNPWICIPHAASDDYVRQLGELFAARLRPELRLYVEYTNEHWNTGGAFDQSRWISENLATDGSRLSRSFAYGKRAAEVWNIFEATGADSLRVLAGQATASNIIEHALEGAATVDGWGPDVISIAAYFNPGKEELYNSYLANGRNLSKEETLELCNQSTAKRSFLWERHAEIAEREHADLIAYEGGQHIVAAFGDEKKDKEYVAWLAEVNRDPEVIEPAYQYLVREWEGAGGKGLCYFQRLAGPTEFGSWGHQEFAGDTDNPKWRAVMDHIKHSDTDEEPAPEPDDEMELIFEWLSEKEFDGTNPEVFELDPAVTRGEFPLVIEYEFIRHTLNNEPDEPIGMCEAVRLDKNNPKVSRRVSIHCDVGEPKWKAVRTRHVDRDTPPTQFIQNGSTPANTDQDDPVEFEVGRRHLAQHVFDSYGDKKNLFAYIDDNGRSIQAEEPRHDVDAGFTRLVIGAASNSDLLTVANVRVYRGYRTVADTVRRANQLGFFFNNDGPTPEPEPIETVEMGTYVKRFGPDGEQEITLTPIES